MRASRVATALVLTLLVGAAGTGALMTGATGAAFADDPTPSRQDVRDARGAVADKAGDVAAVRAQLAVANQRLQDSAVAAAKAAEAYNGARWRATEARKAAAAAQHRSSLAAGDVRRQRQTYGDALVSSYELSPGLTALSAMVSSDGIDVVVDHATTLRNAESALNANYDSFRASATVAEVSADQAEDAEAAAVRAQQQARDARDAAQAAADAAAADAQTIAQEKSRLIAQLADLQHVSVQLAQQRQSDLEARAAAAAAAAEQAEQERQQRAQQRAQARAQQQAQPHQPAQPHQSAQPHQPPSQPSAPPATPPAPAPVTPPTPPAPAGGAAGAIAFARSQIGEPYVWGAAGPNAWDCSGLTMGAWRAGGRYLPHYSVAQYEQSTPISASQLRPGDLVFWGSSSDPGSIYHVALYAGGGNIIQAPRTGVPVNEGSMYAWIAPNFYARP